DSEARWERYRQFRPREVDSVPMAFLNGVTLDGRGGPARQARARFDEFREAINRLLEQPTDLKLTLKATRAGDKVSATATLTGQGYGTDDLRLCFAVVEESVRYPAGNGPRFHRHVVRTLPGGAGGFAVTKPEETREVTVDVVELRGKLDKWLADYASESAPF